MREKKIKGLSVVLAAALAVSSSARADWVYDPSAKTLTQTGTDDPAVIVAVTSDGNNRLTIGSNNKNKDNVKGDIDLSQVITNTEGVVYILDKLGSSCFINCSSISSLTLPDTLTSIGSSAFQNCSGMTDLSPRTFGAGIALNGNAVFYGLSNLSGSLVVEFHKENIGNNFCRNTGKLASLHVYATDACTSIGTDAFNGFGNASALLHLDVPELNTPLGKGSFYNCKAQIIEILSKHAVEFVPDVFAYNANYGLATAVKSFRFSGPACSRESMNALVDGFNKAADLTQVKIYVSQKQDGWTALASTPEKDGEDMTGAPENAFGKFYSTTNTTRWVWAVNESSKYDKADGVALLVLESSLGEEIGAVYDESNTLLAYGQQPENAVGTSVTLSAPIWNGADGRQYEAVASTLYQWDNDMQVWITSSAVREEGAMRTITLGEGRQKLVWEWRLVGFRLNLTVQGAGSVAYSQMPVNSVYEPGTTVTLTATDGAGTFIRYLAEDCDDPSNRSLTVTMDRPRDIAVIFDQPWVMDEDARTMTDGVWTFEVAVYSDEVTVKKAANPQEQNHPVLDFSKPVVGVDSEKNYRITQLDNYSLGKDCVTPVELIFPETLTFVGTGLSGYKSGTANCNDYVTNLVVNCPLLETIGGSMFRSMSNVLSRADNWNLPAVRTISANAFQDMHALGALIFPRADLVSVGTAAFQGMKGIEFIEIAGDELSLSGEMFKDCSATGIVIRSNTQTTMPNSVVRGADTTTLVLDCPNLAIWSDQSGREMTHLERIEILTEAPITLANPSSTANTFDAKNLQEAVFSAAKPSDEFLTVMLSKPADYQVTIFADLNREDWAAAVRPLTTDERAMAARPEKAKRVYEAANGKCAWVVNTGLSGLTLSIR